MLAYFGAPSMPVGSVSLPKGRVQRQSWWGKTERDAAELLYGLFAP